MEEYILQDFKAVHNRIEEDYQTLNIGFAKDQGWCVQFVYQAQTAPQKITMTSVVHHRACTMTDALESGEGTRRMLKIALSFAFKLFPAATRIYFRDVSQIKYETHYIDLPVMKMLQECTTWYEKHFHAKPVDDWSKVKAKIKRNQANYKKMTPWDFVKHGSQIWEQVSPKKNIMFSEWYIERGANRSVYSVHRSPNEDTPFMGGYRRGGSIWSSDI